MPPEPAHERVLIVDFGAQLTQVIARRLRESGVYCEIHPFHAVSCGFLDIFMPHAIILSGGPESVTMPGSPRAAQRGDLAVLAARARDL